MKERLKQGLEQMNLPADGETLARFDAYAEFLVSYNEKVNLTSITEPLEIVEKHFLDSAAPQGLIPKGSRVIDVGTGAGFPGLPLRIVRPDLQLTLLDSLEKRVRFLEEACQIMNLDGAAALHARAEDAARDPALREQFDAAVSRAVANLRVLCEYCLPFVRVGGLFLAWKGPGAEEEGKECEKALRTLGGELSAILPLDIPGTELDHRVVVIKKVRQTPAGYPRKAGKPTKNPL